MDIEFGGASECIRQIIISIWYGLTLSLCLLFVLNAAQHEKMQ